MAVPKAAMDEYGEMQTGQNYVGTTGQIFAMQAKSVTQPTQCAPDQELGLRVLAFHRPHVLGTRSRHPQVSANRHLVLQHSWPV